MQINAGFMANINKMADLCHCHLRAEMVDRD